MLVSKEKCFWSSDLKPKRYFRGEGILPGIISPLHLGHVVGMITSPFFHSELLLFYSKSPFTSYGDPDLMRCDLSARLLYFERWKLKKIGATGFEPATSASRTQHSSQAELRSVRGYLSRNVRLNQPFLPNLGQKINLDAAAPTR